MNNQENKEWERKIEEELYFLTQDGYGGGWAAAKKNDIKRIFQSALLSESDRVRKVINDEIQKKREHKLHLMESGGGIFEGTQTDFSINFLTDLLTTLYPKE